MSPSTAEMKKKEAITCSAHAGQAANLCCCKSNTCSGRHLAKECLQAGHTSQSPAELESAGSQNDRRSNTSPTWAAVRVAGMASAPMTAPLWRPPAQAGSSAGLAPSC